MTTRNIIIGLGAAYALYRLSVQAGTAPSVPSTPSVDPITGIPITPITGGGTMGIDIPNVPSERLVPPSNNFRFRACDAFGCGQYGASRDGGSRSHAGIDDTTSPGQLVYSPIDGVINRTFRAYSDPSRSQYTGIEIVGTGRDAGLTFKIFYATLQRGIGEQVFRGSQIGYDQHIAAIFPGMTNHLHVELLVNGINVDPTPYFT